MSKKEPITLRVGRDDLNRLLILNKIPQYPKHQIKSKFFTLLIKDRCEFLIKELSSRDDLNENEAAILDELISLEGKENGGK